ncbi:hypothetical protein B0H63DRAFT_481295 [Podospora didyma]|uniref:Uncharacterized protein n=1 Tax=Podospora didyma TaxID=330526 RepID=A0AAE0KEV9_9PEZI|nr:hypothetical protein B0H63DRAFT_481295 [Podospora didyma]
MHHRLVAMTEFSSNPPAKLPSSPGAANSTSVDTESSAAPPGYHAFRRSFHADDAPSFAARRRPISGQFSVTDSPLDDLRRRSSTFSDYSFSETMNHLEDSIYPSGAMLEGNDKSLWQAYPVIVIVLPAVVGIMFKNGANTTTDIMLLGVIGVILFYSVTLPWSWYQSAQQVRLEEEIMAGFDEDVTHGNAHIHQAAEPLVSPSSPKPKIPILKDMPEEQAAASSSSQGPSGNGNACAQAQRESVRKAMRELYVYEVIALSSCFAVPMVVAWLLHWFRSSLTNESSQVWLSQTNVMIFTIAALMRPIKHSVALIMHRTLHLQRVVHSNPYRTEVVTPTQFLELLQRVEELEAARASVEDATPRQRQQQQNGPSADLQRKARQQQEAIMAQKVRNEIQPELDTLSRAMRRYEKKSVVQASQTRSQIGAINARVDDAIRLAAAVASTKSSPHWGLFFGRMVDRLVAWLLFPLRIFLNLVTFPVTTISGVLRGGGRKRKPVQEKTANGYCDRKGSVSPFNSGKGSPMRPAMPSPLGPDRVNQRFWMKG